MSFRSINGVHCGVRSSASRDRSRSCSRCSTSPCRRCSWNSVSVACKREVLAGALDQGGMSDRARQAQRRPARTAHGCCQHGPGAIHAQAPPLDAEAGVWLQQKTERIARHELQELQARQLHRVCSRAPEEQAVAATLQGIANLRDLGERQAQLKTALNSRIWNMLSGELQCLRSAIRASRLESGQLLHPNRAGAGPDRRSSTPARGRWPAQPRPPARPAASSIEFIWLLR